MLCVIFSLVLICVRNYTSFVPNKSCTFYTLVLIIPSRVLMCVFSAFSQAMPLFTSSAVTRADMMTKLVGPAVLKVNMKLTGMFSG